MQQQDFLDQIFSGLGIDGASAIALILGLSMVCNFLYRLIPDDSTGFLGIVKPILRVIGLYASNRISSGITVNDVVKDAISERVGRAGDRIDEVHEEVHERIDERIDEAVDSEATRTGIDFGKTSEAAARRIVPPISALFLLFVALPALVACETIPASRAIAERVCQDRDQISVLIAMVEKDPNHPKASRLLAALDFVCPLIVRSVRESR